MKYVKEELEDLIYNQKLSYKEIGRKYSVSDTYVKKISRKLGIVLPKRATFPEGYKPANTGKGAKLYNCLNCGSLCDVYAKKYCSNECQHKYQSKNKYKDFLENNEKYCRSNYSPARFKKHFLKDQDNKCSICEIENVWNNKELVFVLDHIDGNAANNKRENLRLVCPNCDSQLETFKSKNKNSARKERYLLNYKNLPESL